MRRPAPLIAAPWARLIVYALLAGVGALQWVRYVEGASDARALAWVATGAASGALVVLAARLPRRLRLLGALAAAAAGLLLSVALSGLDLRFLLPRHWDELASGLGRGLESLNTVRLPYLGKDPWVLATVELSGALLCWGAAVAATWRPARPGPRMLALVLLLVLAASPVVSLGATSPVGLGLALATLTAAFLFGERLSRRPGLGLAVLAAVALVVAVPLGRAADREEPWFDYRAFSENFTGGTPISFDWDHGYGPIDWPREGAEVLRVTSPVPRYWKADQLTDFDGREWTTRTRVDPGGDEPEDDLPRDADRNRAAWTTTFRVALRRIRTPTVVGAGTVLDVTDSSRPVIEDAIPGRWVADSARELSNGDSYRVRAYVPQPTPQQLAAATVGRDARRHGMLTMRLRYRPDRLSQAPLTPPYPGRTRRPVDEAEVQFAPFESGRRPVASFRATGEQVDGDEALRNSFYDRTWALSKRFRREATSPYDYLLKVNAYLRGKGFRYTEVPPDPGQEAPLEAFLFDTKLGYCQQYSGAMALMLRMGGIPARVASGFSPGGFRQTTGEWIVRDTDAHSWVEAWFDGIGWVTVDPTPPQTPARSQVAAIDPTPSQTPSAAQADRTNPVQRNRRPEGLAPEPTAAAAGGGNGGGLPWPLFAAVALLAGVAGTVVLSRRGRHAAIPDAEAALRELERALRRSGRGAPSGTTLIQLERRLGTSGEGTSYLRALRAARYGAGAQLPTNAQRAAFRRELAAGLGWRGQLRALWALPPRVYPVRRPPR